ncbi:MAG: LysR family transcriptional regulator [Rhizomicrobium sp.]
MADIDLNNIRRLDGGLLLVFRGLLRRRRTTVVARELGLSQSAVSHALTRLRDIFDDPLFIRRPHGLEPTRRALELSPRIDALIDLAGATLERGDAFDPARSERRFSLAAPEFVTALLGGKLVTAFRKQAPRASFYVHFLSRRSPLDAVRRGEIDVALGHYPTVAPGLVSELLFEDRYCVVARRGHPAIKGRISHPVWLKTGHVFADAPLERGIEEETSQVDDIAYVAIVQRWLTALVMVAASDAIATCPLRLAQSQAKVLDLQVISAPFLQDRIPVYAVRRTEGVDPGADWFLDQIRRAAA